MKNSYSPAGLPFSDRSPCTFCAPDTSTPNLAICIRRRQNRMWYHLAVAPRTAYPGN